MKVEYADLGGITETFGVYLIAETLEEVKILRLLWERRARVKAFFYGEWCGDTSEDPALLIAPDGYNSEIKEPKKGDNDVQEL